MIASLCAANTDNCLMKFKFNCVFCTNHLYCCHSLSKKIILSSMVKCDLNFGANVLKWRIFGFWNRKLVYKMLVCTDWICAFWCPVNGCEFHTPNGKCAKTNGQNRKHVTPCRTDTALKSWSKASSVIVTVRCQ